MRVVLVGPDLEENLSIRYLSAALKEAGHASTIAAFDSARDLERARAACGEADLVGLSLCYQVRAPEYLQLARMLSADRPGRPVVAGGHFASCTARELLADNAALDAVVIHEGERTLVELANLPEWTPERLAAVRGIVYRGASGLVAPPPREIVADLDTLPWPDRSGPSRMVAGVPSAYMMGSRGCVASCDYCAITTLHRLAPGKRFRQRDPEKIADEMAALYHDRGVRQFVFHDDNFLVPRLEKNLERIEALDRAVRRRGLRHLGLVLKCRPADVQLEVFRRLREMGLLRVFLGIESGSAEGLLSIGRQQTVAEADRALDVCEALEISTQYTMISFHPEATPATIRADLAFVRRHLAHPLSFCRAEAYAGTPLEQRMIDASRARGTWMARTYGYTDATTALVWRVSRDLLDARCFSPTNLLGQVIRLDHLVAVYRHFYDGREVDQLVERFLALELEANRDSVELLEEIVAACEEHPDATSERLQARIGALRAREQEATRSLLVRVCELREALQARAYRHMGLPRPGRGTPAARARRSSLPRHAAAAALALGLLGCGSEGKPDGGVIEAPPPPDMGQPMEEMGVIEAPPPPDMGQPMDDGGVIEAPPPPMPDAAPPEDAGAMDDGGVIEAPPPPMPDAGPPEDAGAMDDGGVIEAPPPPMPDA